MSFARLILVCLLLLCATPLFVSWAQSGRPPSPQPVPSPTPDSNLSSSGVGNKTAALDTYKVVFPSDATFSTFVNQLNRSGAEGYRVKSVVYARQHLSGEYYSVPVGILQFDETQFEYAWFELTSSVSFAIPAFEQTYAEQSKKGFGLVDYFLSSVSCVEHNPDSIVPVTNCESSYLFLLERERGANSPKGFVLAEASPNWQRKPGGTLANVIREKMADGFYPTEVLSNYQILLAHTNERDESVPEVEVITSSFMNEVKKKIKTLGEQGFRLASIGEECAVMYRRRNEHDTVVYEWLNAKNKNFDKELAKLQKSGATYRMIYRDPRGGNQLVFERRSAGAIRSCEYKTLKLNFQLNRAALKYSPNGHDELDLTPESKEAVKLLNNLANQGFVVRDLFISDVVSKYVSVLLQRAR